MTTDPTTITLQIYQFCNCYGCIKKVEKALGKVGGVKLLKMYPDEGKFKISTTTPPEVIKHYVQQAFPFKKIILLQKINHSHPVSVLDVGGIAKALSTVPQVAGVASVEFIVRVNFSNPHNQSTRPGLPHTHLGYRGGHLDYAAAAPSSSSYTPVSPSAPPMPTNPDQAYEYPPECYAYDKNHRP